MLTIKKNIFLITTKIVRINYIKNIYILVYNKLTYNSSTKNFRSKNNNLYEECHKPQKSKFLISNNDEFDYITSNNQEIKNKHLTKPKTCFNTSNNNTINQNHYNTNREKTNLLFENINKNKSLNSRNDNTNISNDSMNKYINLIYEDQITKLKDDIKEIKKEKEKIKDNIKLFIILIKKYSNKLYYLIEKIKNNMTNNSINFNDIITTLYNLNDFIEKIETNNFTLEDNIYQNKLYYQSINDSQEIEKNINEIISKYEKKISILERQNKEMYIKIKTLKNEKNILKQQSEEERNIKENMLNKLNMMKEINNNLEKKNKILDSKCRSYFNQSTRTKYEQKNFEDEIEYKNKIIKYLENMIQKKDFDKNDEIFKKINERNITNINKIMDLKKNLKKVINVTKNINNEENEKSINMNNTNSNDNNKKNKYFIENGNLYLNEKSISSFSYKSNNNAKVKQEIDLLDKEIEQIQTKLETMLENNK